MLSYIDILTLILTLLVLLLVLQPKHESRVSEEMYEFDGISSQARADPQPQPQPKPKPKPKPDEVIPDDEIQAEDSIASIQKVDPDPEQEVSAESGVETAGVAAEPAFDIEAPGNVDWGAKESALQQPETGTSKTTLDHQTSGTWPLAKKIDGAAMHPLADRVEYPQSDSLEALVSELKKRDLDSRLKVAQVAEGVHLEVSEKILFAKASAQLKREGQILLNDLAQVLLQHRGMISVEGHTDDRPISNTQFPSNWELSSGRATSVTRYLIGHGLDPEKLRAVGYADTRPLDSNTTSEGRMRNRRVSIVLTPARKK
ncbi:MAG: OmpA family protein [Sedimenticolaceae bacterium]